MNVYFYYLIYSIIQAYWKRKVYWLTLMTHRNSIKRHDGWRDAVETSITLSQQGGFRTISEQTCCMEMCVFLFPVLYCSLTAWSYWGPFSTRQVCVCKKEQELRSVFSILVYGGEYWGKAYAWKRDTHTHLSADLFSHNTPNMDSKILQYCNILSILALTFHCSEHVDVLNP